MTHAAGNRQTKKTAGALAAASVLLVLTVPASALAVTPAASATGARPTSTAAGSPFVDAGAVARRRGTRDGTAAQQRARSDLAGQLGPQAVVDVDPATGTVRSLQRLDGALSDPASGDRGDVALRYVAAHRDALGLTQADVDALVVQPTSPVGAAGITIVRLTQAVDGIPAFSGGLRVALDRGGRVLSVTGSPPLRPHAVHADADPGRRRRGARRPRPSRRGPHARRRGTTRDRAGGRHPRRARRLHRRGHPAAGLARCRDRRDARPDRRRRRRELGRGAAAPEPDQGRVGSPVPQLPRAETDPDALKASNNAPVSVDFAAAGWLAAGATTLSGPHVHAYSDLDDDDKPSAPEEVGPNDPTGWRYGLTPFSAPAATPKACASATSAADKTATCTWDPTTLGSWRANREQTTQQSFYLASTYMDHLAAAPIDFSDFTGVQALQLETDDGATTGTMANAPNTAHVNNANMTTPPAGEAPRMQMYLYRYRTTTPLSFRNVNGGDDAAILWHELTHGLSNRLVTYDDGTGALSSAEGGALGEAWSDWYALDEVYRRGLEVDSAETAGDAVFGAHVEADPGALRTEGLDCAPAQAAARCPGGAGSGAGGYTYGDLGRIVGGPEVHADGEIWAQTLWDLRLKLIERSGSLEAGSRLAEQLVTDGMRMTPPEPSFLDARNAILAAATAQSGSLRDLVWGVMAARGMGYYASAVDGTDTTPVEDFHLPPAAGAPTGAITGTVTDADTGLGLGGVHVSFAGLSGNQPAGGRDLETVTAADGTWRLDVPAGTYGALAFGEVPGLTSAVQRTVTVTAGQTRTLDQTLHRDFAASAIGATASSTDESAAGFGCGSIKLLDQIGATGWSTFNPSSASTGNPNSGTPTATVTLPRAISMTGLAINPSNVCGDPSTAALRDYRVQALGTDGVWRTVAEGSFAAADVGHLKTLAPAAVPGPITQVRLLLLGAQASTSDFIDVADLEVYGAVPNQLPSGRLIASPGQVATGQVVRLDASSFTDPDSRITGYDWDLDGNGTVDRTTAESSTLTSYPTGGTVVPRVSVRDFRGGAGTATTSVSVIAPTPPTTIPTPPPTTTATVIPPVTLAVDPPPKPVAEPRLISLVGAKKGRATVKVSCPQACTLAATATLPKSTARRLGRRSRTALQLRRGLKAGASKSSLILSGAVVGSAKRKSVRRLTVTFKLAVTTGAGGSDRATRTLTLSV